jgi:hypothetical protein
MKLLTALFALFKREPATAIADTALPKNEPILDLLGTTLREQGVEAVEMNGFLRLPSGIELKVKFLEVFELENGNVRTSTQIVASHASHFSRGLPEFQHSVGGSVEQSISDGFSNWAKTDLVALQDSIRGTPEDCTFMDMNFLAAPSSGPKTRRVVFGPTGHLVSPAAQTQDEEHPFCPCCLFTKNFEAFRLVMQYDETVGIRLFASRDGDGGIAADCRINGDDFPEGVKHLTDYVRSWPERPGLEFRKQYVVIRSVETPEIQVPCLSK